ncbi:hypothetical protein [Cohnella rhizosphaerae]|uniref:Uncharacterized protein n=1 Tax=Cohnella rhizosphaerae TaxID=1457232 RepID=A0A9X4QTU1_9BACL|nr:hypothetical protein [Cohnella rhizosphaerae]MDG0810733.1 hypothetical protein [Cohnella rhizosphaerae]
MTPPVGKAGHPDAHAQDVDRPALVERGILAYADQQLLVRVNEQLRGRPVAPSAGDGYGAVGFERRVELVIDAEYVFIAVGGEPHRDLHVQ